MITLTNDSTLSFSFPEVHKDAVLGITFQRTLRIPDDGRTHFLPPGLGSFPLLHVDDHPASVPPDWTKHGGVMLPMYQSEAMWIYFNSGSWGGGYPFAIKIATGKINAVSGKPYREGLNRRPQDYVVSPGQPWLDGFCVKKGAIRQFVAMPLGAGYTAEEQLTGKADVGGIQIVVYPLKAEIYSRIRKDRAITDLEDSLVNYCCAPSAMGLAPGGLMKQDIYADEFDKSDWDLEHSSRCFVHIANSLVWRRITGQYPPTVPPTAAEYTSAGLPWFDYYDDKLAALDGSQELAGMKSVAELGKRKNEVPLPENESVSREKVILLRKGLQQGQVREWKP
jgi:hypothetical protein